MLDPRLIRNELDTVAAALASRRKSTQVKTECPRSLKAGLNIALSVVACLFACWCGILLARQGGL